MRDERGDILPNAHTIGFLRRICKLLYLNIRPVFVFDGSTPALKKKTVAERRRRREQQDARVKKTAEKLLLNRLKQYVVREFEKSKAASLDSEVENPSQEIQGKASQDQPSTNKNPELLHNMGGKDEKEIKLTSVQSSDGSDELDGFEVDVESGVDPEVLSTLPPSMQLEIMLQLREKAMAAARGGFQSRCTKPEEFSQYQIQQYLNSTGLRRKLDAIRGVAQKNSDIAKPVAAEEDKHYVLYREEEKEGKESQDIDMAPNYTIIDQTESKALNISFCVQDDSDVDDMAWEDVEEEAPEDEKINSQGRSKYWSLSHGFQKGRSLGNWGEKSSVTGQDTAYVAEEEVIVEDAIKKSLIEQHSSHMDIKSKKNETEYLLEERGIRAQTSPNKPETLNQKSFATEKEISPVSAEQEHMMLDEAIKHSLIEPHNFDEQKLEKKGHPLGRGRMLGANSDKNEKSQSIVPTLDSQDTNLKDEQAQAKVSDEAMPRKADEGRISVYQISDISEPRISNSMEESSPKGSFDLRIDKKEKNVATVTPESQNNCKIVSSSIGKEGERDSNNQTSSSMKPQNLDDTPSGLEVPPDFGENADLRQQISIVPTQLDTVYTIDIKESKDQEREKPCAVETTNKMFDLQQLAQEEAILRSDRRAATGQSDSPTEQMFTECQELLQMFGIPYIIAPTEAEAQCAWLDANNLVDGVVTDDNDAFLFGATRVYRHIFEENKYVEEYRSEDVERELGFSRNSLILMALLLGSDYTPGIAGVGVVNAVEILSTFTGFEGLIEFRDWVNDVDEDLIALMRDDQTKETQGSGTTQEFKQKHKNIRKSWVLPEDFPSQEVIDSYQRPTLDDSKSKFTFMSPDFSMLESLCLRKFGWDEVKINELFQPVKKSLSQRDKQQTIQGFLTFREKFARVRSKRLAQAVEKVKSKNSKRKERD